MTSNLQDIFINLVRIGIGQYNSIVQPKHVDWLLLKELADKQGLSAIVLDALNASEGNLTRTMPVQMKLEWIGEILQNYERRYLQYEKAVSSLAGWYNKHGFKMMVLKGYACSLDWPKPDHRPCGDIDIWLFGQQKIADRALAQEKGIKVDSSHHHHTVFEWQGFTVENHYDFVNVHAHRSSKEVESVFKRLGQDDIFCIEVNGENMYLPSPNLHAFFLIRHMASHFAAAEITLRQVFDWAFFVKKHTKEIDWEWLTGLMEKYNMKDFYNSINAICVGDLGFKVNIFPNVQFDPSLKDKVLSDIISPEYLASEPSGFIKRMIYKYRRWQGNAWKQKMCYNESRLYAFFRGAWAHLLKPEG